MQLPTLRPAAKSNPTSFFTCFNERPPSGLGKKYNSISYHLYIMACWNHMKGYTAQYIPFDLAHLKSYVNMVWFEF